MLQPGFYRHYKGMPYHVLEVAIHSETREELVAYRALYGDFLLFVRPKNMFMENVTIDGKTMKRFAFVSTEIPAEHQHKA